MNSSGLIYNAKVPGEPKMEVSNLTLGQEVRVSYNSNFEVMRIKKFNGLLAKIKEIAIVGKEQRYVLEFLDEEVQEEYLVDMLPFRADWLTPVEKYEDDTISIEKNKYKTVKVLNLAETEIFLSNRYEIDTGYKIRKYLEENGYNGFVKVDITDEEFKDIQDLLIELSDEYYIKDDVFIIEM